MTIMASTFLSTPAARRATVSPLPLLQGKAISIHALREEGDSPVSQPCSTAGISIHALREEGDTSFGSLSPISSQFLSTPSARRATPQVNTVVFQFYYFYPRPPRGGRPTAAAPSTSAAYFYPHPPRGGRLLPRLPEKPYMEISIHALREEGDDGQQLVQVVRVDFYPRPPRGGRLQQPERMGDRHQISIHALREEGD